MSPTSVGFVQNCNALSTRKIPSPFSISWGGLIETKGSLQRLRSKNIFNFEHKDKIEIRFPLVHKGLCVFDVY